MSDTKFTIFHCRRSSDEPHTICQSCGGSTLVSETESCTFELRGPKEGQHCDKILCRSCRGMGRPLCPPHRRLLDKERR